MSALDDAVAAHMAHPAGGHENGVNAQALRVHFRYTANRRVLHSIPVDLNGAVVVAGDPDNAAYEWVVCDHGRVSAHSDCAYGNPEIALRDGLIAYYGLPAEQHTARPA